MNIFILDECPVISAQSLCDLHVNKMLIESTQLLCIYLNKKGYTTPYKSNHHVNHPCVLWLEDFLFTDHLKWLQNHAYALANEYKYRTGKNHKCSFVLIKISSSIFDVIQKNIHVKCMQTKELFPRPKFIQVMPDEYKLENTIEAYRNYYISKQYTMKRPMKWTKRKLPVWFKFGG